MIVGCYSKEHIFFDVSGMPTDSRMLVGCLEDAY